MVILENLPLLPDACRISSGAVVTTRSSGTLLIILHYHSYYLIKVKNYLLITITSILARIRLEELAIIFTCAK